MTHDQQRHSPSLPPLTQKDGSDPPDLSSQAFPPSGPKPYHTHTMGYVHGCKNETDPNSLSSAVCLASAMQGGPPGPGGPHPPADCDCRLCRTFRKVVTLVFGANSTSLLRDRCQPYFEGLYTQLLEIALDLRGSAAPGEGGAAPSGEVRPGGPPPPGPTTESAGVGGAGSDPVPAKAAPGQTGVKKEEEGESSEAGGRKKEKRPLQARPVTP